MLDLGFKTGHTKQYLKKVLSLSFLAIRKELKDGETGSQLKRRNYKVLSCSQNKVRTMKSINANAFSFIQHGVEMSRPTYQNIRDGISLYLLGKISIKKISLNVIIIPIRKKLLLVKKE